MSEITVIILFYGGLILAMFLIVTWTVLSTRTYAKFLENLDTETLRGYVILEKDYDKILEEFKNPILVHVDNHMKEFGNRYDLLGYDKEAYRQYLVDEMWKLVGIVISLKEVKFAYENEMHSEYTVDMSKEEILTYSKKSLEKLRDNPVQYFGFEWSEIVERTEIDKIVQKEYEAYIETFVKNNNFSLERAVWIKEMLPKTEDEIRSYLV